MLEWSATCKGRQFDRIFGVWLGGVELLRSCTAEPRATGIVWRVKKDVTRYYSLLMKEENQTLAVYLGNLVDKTYTGVYHVKLTFHFYPAVGKYSEILASGHTPWADLILPISRNLPLKDGLWFEIENSTDLEVKQFKIPRNAYRAVLEVYLSFHENDEFWYSNPTNDYISANNLTGTPGNGPFREVLVWLDGKLVGAVWPFTVIYTGGVNPLLWRPITGIGSFDLPSYNIEITPYLGRILDGKTHTFGFSVTNALNVWYIDANLHIWLDHRSTRTQGKLLGHGSGGYLSTSTLYMKGLNASFFTQCSRSISSTGWVKSSHGKLITQSIQEVQYTNLMVMGDDGNMQTVNQTIHFDDGVYVNSPSLNHSIKSSKLFPLYLYSDYVDQGNKTYLSTANVTLGFNDDMSELVGTHFSKTSVENLQTGQGSIIVKNNLVSSGLGSTQQVYNYGSPRFCYFRNVSSSNYTILYDIENSSSCRGRPQALMEFSNGKFSSIPARKVFLTSDLQEDEKGV